MDLNLKRVFMEVGNKLVQRHGWQPASSMPVEVKKLLVEAKTTAGIVIVTELFNMHPEMRDILEEHGLVWPVELGDELQQT
jgi:hypothetical protein